jgi:hypothetical protein
MTLLPILLALVIPQSPTAPAQSAPPVPTAVDVPSEAASDVAPWKGSFEEGFSALRAHAEKREFDEAISIANGLLAPHSILRWKLDLAAKGGWRETLCDAIDPLLDFAGWNGLEPRVRAEVWFAKGVIQTLAKDAGAAEDAFEKARELAGPGELRNDAMYDLGCLALALGEEQRAKLPEISGQPAQPAMPPIPTTPGAAAPPKEPDPLELARAAYLHARERFVERLKSDWNDADTRANVELVMKRLKELDEIEKKREEQKKQDENKDKQDKDQQKQDQDQKDKQDKDNKEKPKDDKKPEDQKEPDKKPGEDKKDEQKPPEQPKPEEKKDDAKKPEPPKVDPKEQQMSKEEMTQILDKLKQLEEQATRLQEQLKQSRRVRVKKDW